MDVLSCKFGVAQTVAQFMELCDIAALLTTNRKMRKTFSSHPVYRHVRVFIKNYCTTELIMDYARNQRVYNSIFRVFPNGFDNIEVLHDVDIDNKFVQGCRELKLNRNMSDIESTQLQSLPNIEKLTLYMWTWLSSCNKRTITIIFGTLPECMDSLSIIAQPLQSGSHYAIEFQYNVPHITHLAISANVEIKSFNIPAIEKMRTATRHYLNGSLTHIRYDNILQILRDMDIDCEIRVDFEFNLSMDYYTLLKSISEIYSKFKIDNFTIRVQGYWSAVTIKNLTQIFALMHGKILKVHCSVERYNLFKPLLDSVIHFETP